MSIVVIPIVYLVTFMWLKVICPVHNIIIIMFCGKSLLHIILY